MFQNLFNIDNVFWRALRRIADILILNFTFLIFCIPLITIGAAATGLYSITLKMAKGEDPYIFKGFWDAFKSNFKQSTIIWLILLLMGGFLIVDLYLTGVIALPFIQILRYVFLFVAILYLIILCYVFAVQSKFENSIFNTIKNALIMGIAHLLPWTVLIILLDLMPILLFFFKPDWFFYFVLPAMCFFGFSTVAYLNSKIFLRIFKRFIPEEEDTDSGEIITE